MYQMKMTTKIVLNKTKMEMKMLKKKKKFNPIKKLKRNILDSANLGKNLRLNISI